MNITYIPKVGELVGFANLIYGSNGRLEASFGIVLDITVTDSPKRQICTILCEDGKITKKFSRNLIPFSERVQGCD